MLARVIKTLTSSNVVLAGLTVVTLGAGGTLASMAAAHADPLPSTPPPAEQQTSHSSCAVSTCAPTDAHPPGQRPGAGHAVRR